MLVRGGGRFDGHGSTIRGKYEHNLTAKTLRTQRERKENNLTVVPPQAGFASLYPDNARSATEEAVGQRPPTPFVSRLSSRPMPYRLLGFRVFLSLFFEPGGVSQVQGLDRGCAVAGDNIGCFESVEVEGEVLRKHQLDFVHDVEELLVSF